MATAGNISVVNLDETQPDLVCDDLPPLPSVTYGATGKLFQGQTPIICGGYYPFEYYCDCYALANGSWANIDQLETCRSFSSSVLLTLDHPVPSEEHLLVIGGSIGSIETATSVEDFDGKTWRKGMVANMPRPQTQFCTVRINETNIISIGGLIGSQQSTFFYNSADNEWTEGPVLNKPRISPVCGMLNWLNPETGVEEQIVVAAAGDNQPNSELLFLKDYHTSGSGWVQGPDLPSEAFLASMIEFEESVILVGGTEGVDGFHLFKLDSPSGPWVVMEQTLKEKHNRGVAFLVPDEQVNCH